MDITVEHLTPALCLAQASSHLHSVSPAVAVCGQDVPAAETAASVSKSTSGSDPAEAAESSSSAGRLKKKRKKRKNK